MNLPEQPATFRRPSPAERPWWWRLETAGGDEVVLDPDDAALAHLADQRFASQADAESWVGEVFSDLAAHGVDAVVLLDLDREVYGPMSLHA